VAFPGEYEDMASIHDEDARTGALRQMFDRIGIAPDVEHPCPYLPEQRSQNLVFKASSLPPGIYQSLMDLNFRRSGSLFYRPACPECRQCQALRVLVNEFKPNRTQRRCWKENRDLDAEIAPLEPTREKHRLYQKYLAARHDRAMSDSWKSFIEFLYEAPVSVLEVTFRLAGRLVAVGIIDVEPSAVSTLYCYFDPDEARRSPGVFNVLWTIGFVRKRNIPHLYLGYYIRDCAKMNYKINYRPCEVLVDEGTWQRYEM
jgi:arginine-tRNA-protein transferase